jgi:hypothetical protein
MNVLAILSWSKTHWRAIGLVLGSGLLSGWAVRHYFPRMVAVPGPERIVTQTVEVKGECHADTETKYVYQTVKVPGPSPSCPDQTVLVPTPVVTAGAGATDSGSGRTSVVDAPPVPGATRAEAEPRKWTARGFAGVARTGPQVGGGISYDLFGPVEVGIQVTVPTNSPADIAVGATLGVRF